MVVLGLVGWFRGFFRASLGVSRFWALGLFGGFGV